MSQENKVAVNKILHVDLVDHKELLFETVNMLKRVDKLYGKLLLAEQTWIDRRYCILTGIKNNTTKPHLQWPLKMSTQFLQDKLYTELDELKKRLKKTRKLFIEGLCLEEGSIKRLILENKKSNEKLAVKLTVDCGVRLKELLIPTQYECTEVELEERVNKLWNKTA